jgi:hypothetical protein
MAKIHFYTYDCAINEIVESKYFKDTAQFRDYLRKTAKGNELEGNALDFDINLWHGHIIEILNHRKRDMIIAHESYGYQTCPEKVEDYFVADSEKAFEEYLIECLPKLPEDKEHKKSVDFYKMYFDFEQYKNDSLINDYFESNGYYFARH